MHASCWQPVHACQCSKQWVVISYLLMQVETTNGKKDLRMRCASEEAVQLIMQDIRSTVQVSLMLLIIAVSLVHGCVNANMLQPDSL